MVNWLINHTLGTVPVSTIMQGIFMNLPKRKIATEHMQNTFYKLTQEYPGAFDFDFQEGKYPYHSGRLEIALSKLGDAGVLDLWDNEKYVVSKKGAQTIKTNFENKWLDSDVEYALARISKDFVTFLNEVEAKANGEQELERLEEELLECAPMGRKSKRR